MSRSRCTRSAGDGPGHPDPERWADRWAELGRRVRTRAAADGVRPLIPDDVWDAAADPDTWNDDIPGSPGPLGARVLAGTGGHPTPGGTVVVAGGVIGALALWQAPRVGFPPGVHPGLGGAALAGLPPGVTLEVLGAGDLDLAARFLGWDPLRLGGVTLEVLGHAATGPGDPHHHDWDRARLLACLLTGREEICIRDNRITRNHHPDPFNPGVRLHLHDLDTGDPRLARWFLHFDWRPRPVTHPGGSRPLMVRRTSWLTAVAPADRGAAGMLADRLLKRDQPDPTPVVLALRAAGHPVGWSRPVDPDRARPGAAPVLWWRRMLGRLVRDPDRLRAVEEIEAAWVRLCTGRPR